MLVTLLNHPDKPLWLKLAETSSLFLLALLALWSLFSNILKAVRSRQTGQIRLPESRQPALTKKEEFGRQLLDNIDELPQDDGEFVQVDKFWRTVIPLRVLHLLPIIAFAAVQGVRDYDTVIRGPTAWNWIAIALTSGVCMYQVTLSLVYAFTKDIARHTSFTYDLFTLSSALFLHIYFVTIGQYLANGTYVILTWIEYSLFGLSLLQIAMVGSIPCEPRRYFDLKRVYNKAVQTAIKEKEDAQAQIEEYDESPLKHVEPNANSEYAATILSRLIVGWVVPVISKMSKLEQADIQDLPGLHPFLRTQDTVKDAMGFEGTKISAKRWGVTRAFLWEVWVPQWRAVLIGVGISFALVPLWYVPHVALQQVLSAIELGLDKRTAVAWAIMLLIGRLGNLLVLLMQLQYTETYASPRIRAHAQYLLYSKLLTRNIFAKADEEMKRKNGKNGAVSSKADILNLISVDISAIGRLGFSCVRLFRSQIQMLLGATYVWVLLGPSGLWGLSTLLITSVPAYLLTKWQYKIFEKRLAVSDEKVSLMQEAIQAISMIKMMAAERFWYKRIKTVRDLEFKRMTQARLLGFLSGMLYAASPTIIVVVSFAHYTLIAEKPLTATIAFTSIAVFEELRPVLLSLPEDIASLLQQILSAKRIGSFIRARDVDYLGESLMSAPTANPDAPLYVRGTIAWNEDASSDASEPMSDGQTMVQPSFRLQDIDLSFPRGQITLIAGKFGSGKTLMLLAMMGEARLIEGRISYAISDIMPPVQDGVSWELLPTGVAYVPQTPWLQSLSIRENILFGLPLDMERYRAVVFAVGLIPDLEILDDADLTEIGERGKILSGGQKARVSLARAVYSRAATLLLDDVISAVDAQTSQHIVQHCFQGPLMVGRTVIIASHAVETLAPLADQAVFLDAGQAVWTGTGVGLMQSEHMAHLKTESGTPIHQHEEEGPSSESLEKRRGSEKQGPNTFVIKEALPKTPRQLIMEEKREKGTTELKYWRELLHYNGGKMFWVAMLLVLFGSTLAPVAERRVLELWTREGADPDDEKKRVLFWVALYSGLSGLTIILDSIFGLYRYFGGLRATKRIHGEMLETVLRAKMIFYSRTRAGSIVQRFGKDLSEVLEASELIGTLGESVITILVAFLSVTYYGGWLFAGITVAMLVALYKPSVWYRSAGRQVKRLDAVMPGPINAIYGETIAGTAVIRAFGVQSVFVSELLSTLNMKINALVWRLYLARWLFINLRLMDVIIVATVLFVILTSPNMSAATAGFILAFAGTITSNINYLLVYIRNFALAGSSLERTAEYRRLEKEGGDELFEGMKDDEQADMQQRLTEAYGDWPSSGRLDVQELSARYGPDMPEILHAISFSVEGGQRVGIVGATGGGKSTLAKALFSFVDVSHGRILIDGKDIAHIPLGQVRSKLGIIAQDPILLSGTLRLNLDIESRYTDEQLYDALHQVQLLRKTSKSSPASSTVSVRQEDEPSLPTSPTSSSSTMVADPGREGNANIFENLDFEIKSGGENLSAGQKQLVVLARALLKRHKILILDEATASIDSATDAEISRVVHEEFTGATVLIIAHRLRTIMPCSKILVMDKGNLVQQGSPIDLIRQQGKFQDLCMAAGSEEYQHLVALAAKEAKKDQLVDVDV